MNEQPLLRLPHKQFVFTPWSGRCTDLPKVLRVFFRHDKRLHGEISRLIYRLVLDFATAAAGKPIRTAAVVVLQTAGAFSRRITPLALPIPPFSRPPAAQSARG